VNCRQPRRDAIATSLGVGKAVQHSMSFPATTPTRAKILRSGVERIWKRKPEQFGEIGHGFGTLRRKPSVIAWSGDETCSPLTLLSCAGTSQIWHPPS